MEMILILTIIATIALLSCTLQLSIKVTAGTHMIAYASTNITGRYQTEDFPKLNPTPLSSADQPGDAIVNRTNAIPVGASTGNNANETALVTEGSRCR